MEPDQRIGNGLDEPIDLGSFLYTISNTSKTAPEFKISESGDIELKRTNTTILTKDIHTTITDNFNYLGVQISTTPTENTTEDISKKYASGQLLVNSLNEGGLEVDDISLQDILGNDWRRR